jgi:2-keto-4-pentenoate hydratase
MTVPDHLVDSAIDQAAQRLEEAYATRTPCAPIRDLLGESDIAAAYAVQRRQIDHRTAVGARVIGRKTGLTSRAVQQQLGVDQPDFGVLLDDMDVTAEPQVPSIRLLQPKAEAEIAFVLGADLTEGDLHVAQCRDSVAHAVAALEIVDSRVADWDIRITDTVADNASSGLFVLGEQTVPLTEFEPVEATMRMFLDGEQVSEGTGAACLGDPLNALSWLARIARDYGQPLTAGQVVLSGALGPMVSAPPGCTVRAEISTLGEVVADFSQLEETR